MVQLIGDFQIILLNDLTWSWTQNTISCNSMSFVKEFRQWVKFFHEAWSD